MTKIDEIFSLPYTSSRAEVQGQIGTETNRKMYVEFEQPGQPPEPVGEQAAIASVGTADEADRAAEHD